MRRTNEQNAYLTALLLHELLVRGKSLSFLNPHDHLRCKPIPLSLEVAMQTCTGGGDTSATHAFYGRVLDLVSRASVPFLVGGAYAFESYTGIERHTKDLDLFVAPDDARFVLGLLATAGYETESTFAHWLGKAFGRNDDVIDVIYSSGNGLCRVDADWFTYTVPGKVLGRLVQLCPAEEAIWSKSFIMERERFDGADVAHILRSRGRTLDWERLLARFGSHWPVLLSHLVLFRYVYPAEHDAIPGPVLDDLVKRLVHGTGSPVNPPRLCRGTLLSREQYLPDIHKWHYHDARLPPVGRMTADDIQRWTDGIDH
jgi:hypothetical protein